VDPDGSELWKIANYRDFLEARKVLLAAEANRRMEELLHGDTKWLEGRVAAVSAPVVGGITSDEEEQQLERPNKWIESLGLPRGSLDFADAGTGEQKAVFDLAWPDGIQEELSEPVAVLLNESTETLATASKAGFAASPRFQNLNSALRARSLLFTTVKTRRSVRRRAAPAPR
jgi:hypothetical protein